MSDDNSTDDIERLINRLEEALDRQKNSEGGIASTPQVAYCFDCDEIAVDTWCPDGCIDHKTVFSDGHEHDGIGSAIITLQALNSDTEQ